MLVELSPNVLLLFAVTVTAPWLVPWLLNWSTGEPDPTPEEPELTNFEKVLEFNEMFGIPIADDPVLDIFDKDPKLVNYRLELIREEVKELEAAVVAKDMKETLDALSDILYVVYGMGASLGLDLDTAVGLVHKSNMSKLCTSEEEAKLTLESYERPIYRVASSNCSWEIFFKSTGRVINTCNTELDAIQLISKYPVDLDRVDRYNSPEYRKSNDDKYWVVFNSSTKKILKNVNYQPVCFNNLFE